jgi:hypothetical protein
MTIPKSKAETADRILSAIPNITEAPYVEFPLCRGAMSDNGATPWYAEMGLGTPAQSLRFMLDTGTVNTWITAASCTTDACKMHRAFNPDESGSYIPSGDPSRIVPFGPWGSMTVLLGNDKATLQLCSKEKKAAIDLEDAMGIYLSTQYDGTQFAELDCDGGLAIPSVSCDTPSALLEQLNYQKLIEQPIASFYFNPGLGQGTCLMGAVDYSRFDPSTLNLLPVVPLGGDLNYLWNVRLDSFVVAGETIPGISQLVLDTGSSRFKGGCTVISNLLAAITDNGARPTRVSSTAAFADYPDLTLSMGGREYLLTPEQYFISIGPSTWEVGVHYLAGLPDEMLLVGSVFLDTVYSIFHFAPSGPDHCIVWLASPVHDTLKAAGGDTPLDLTGTWQNEFGSTLEIGPVSSNGTFTGVYRSSTGATGVYPVMGVADPDPGDTMAVSFSVTWRSLQGQEDPSWHWVSGFTGLLQIKDGQEVLSTTYLLQQNVTETAPEWMATAVYPSSFTKKS